MNPVEDPTPPSSAGRSAGQMLRAAREAQGLHLALLSVRLKVSVRQLEALEADQHAVLKGAAFERALALAVCRQLGMDPAPVLAALPQATQHVHIEPVGIEARRNAVRVPPRSNEGKGLSRQVLVLAVLMLLGAVALIWWPGSTHNEADEAPDPAQAAVPLGQASDPLEEPEPAASAASAEAPSASLAAPAVAPASEPVPAKVPLAQPLASAAAARVPVAAASVAASAAAAPLRLRMQADAWVEVRDSQGQIAIKRMAKAGETLQLSLAAPLFVYVSKADGVELSWQGKPLDLQPHTRNNEVRLQIKP